MIAETDTRTEATTEALRTVVDEFSRLQRERVYEGELEGAQNFLAGSFPLSIESPDAIATRVLNQLFYDLPLEELPAYPERVRSVTPDDIQRVAKPGSSRRSCRWCWSGTPSRFIGQLAGAGFATVERIADRGARPGVRRPAPPAPCGPVAAAACPG